MKRLLLAILLVCFLAVSGSAMNPAFLQMVSNGTSTTCQSLSTQANSDSGYTIGGGAGTYYRGFLFKDASNAHEICEHHAWLKKHEGDVSGKTYYAQVWTLSGDNLDTQQGSDSNGVTGDNAWNNTEVTFTWASPITLTANTTYVLVLTHKGVDGTNMTNWHYEDEQNTWAYCEGIGGWGSDKARTVFDAEDDPKSEIYTMQ